MPVQPSGGSSRPAWVLAVLKALGTHDNGDNGLALELWAQSEGAVDYTHNWLNTTMPGYGGVSINSVGVKHYPTFADGVKATAATIRQPIMSGIFYALTSGVDLDVIYHAINSSKWNPPGTQGGHYPVTLYNYLVALGHFPGGTVVAGTRPPPDPTAAPPWDWSPLVKRSADLLHTHGKTIRDYARAIRT